MFENTVHANKNSQHHKKQRAASLGCPWNNLPRHRNPDTPVYDGELKDTENIPWGMSFDEYMSKEVLPYAPESEIDVNVKDSGPLQDGQVGVVGTSINFNRYFYEYEEPRDPKEIAKEILELEDGLELFMKGFLQ